MNIIFSIILFTFIPLLFGCNNLGYKKKYESKTSNIQEKIQIILADTAPTKLDYEAYITWQNYDGFIDSTKAVYIWSGEEVGEGNAGLNALVKKIRGLPIGSRILIYPSYSEDWETWSLQARTPPFSQGYAIGSTIRSVDTSLDAFFNFGKLKKPMQERKLIVIFSRFNQKGQRVGIKEDE